MSGPDLRTLAGWDTGLVRGATGSLTSVAGRLPTWRSRLEAVGRELETPGCWTGPAAAEAAAAVLVLSTAVAAVTRACQASLDEFDQLTVRAAGAADLATEALALAARAGIELDGAGEPVVAVLGPAGGMSPDQVDALAARAGTASRAAAAAEEALRSGGLAAAAAIGADDALRSVGVVDAFAPVTFADLAGLVRGVPVPRVPAGRAPADVATWWAGLDAAAQRDLIIREPDALGALDGVPAWARDRANRLLLARALQDPDGPGYDVATAVAGALAAAEAGSRPAQLYEFVPRLGLVAVASGDLDTADDVGVLVPGISTTAADDLGGLVRNAGDVADAAEAAGGAAVATVAWLGYRTPQNLYEAASRTDARLGGRALAAALDGLAGARAASGAPAARTTVLAHSYGTVVADEAADRPGPMAADAVVLMGSPGMGSGGAAGLEAPEVYVGVGGADPVAALHWFGTEPWEPGFGAIPLPTDPDAGHGDYYDPAGPTLTALGEVVAGTSPPGG